MCQRTVKPAVKKSAQTTISHAGYKFCPYPTFFKIQHADQVLKKQAPWAPFAGEEEWEFSQWIIGSGISQRETDRLLKTAMVSFQGCKATSAQRFTSFHNNKSFLHTIDLLPGPTASWKLIEITVEGTLWDSKGNTLKERLDVWG
ncbi:hypothetical protein JAAARDRAFT_142922 [Jaapia argillacea MUCL 33604]|uniref:Uncharacterized protein n=1 Tax=Jaapia argillacea MUCL 33604 TaxID=933084 RepID=A0A067P7H6_9AGAM|nr:hypothetical protein JAAARDRAFT_142922 [Jaapia argillacea MUCL 33604]